jgi:hypothetical protein
MVGQLFQPLYLLRRNCYYEISIAILQTEFPWHIRMHAGQPARSTVRNDLCYIPTKRRALANSPSPSFLQLSIFTLALVSPLPLSFSTPPTPLPRRLSFLLRFTSSFSRFYCGEAHLCISFHSLPHVLVATSHSINLIGFHDLPENQSPPTPSLIYQR